MILCCYCGRLNPCPYGKGHELPDANAFLANNNKSRDDAEGELRSNKPPPINPLIEQGIYESKNAVQ
jgi:hypothetical protein